MFPPAEPTATFPYRVDRQVGVGSMGVVYRATEIDLDRTVAIKTLRRSILEEESPEVRDEIRRRFLQEAQAAGRLSHPGVTTVYRVGEEADLPFIVMEWLEGETVEGLMKRSGKYAPADAARLAVALLETLEAAHQSGIVHRDIKPSNLVVLEDGRLKVTDFGIALVKGRELVRTQAGVVLATPKFASPEQLRGTDVDGRADLFAVGVLLYHLVSGEFPFAGASFMELASAILQNEPTPLRERLPDVPQAFDAVVRTALCKQRDDRYSSAAAMADALRALLSPGDASSLGMPAGRAPALTGATEVPGEPDDAPDDGEITQVAPVAPVLRDLPRDPALALVELVKTWPMRRLGRQSTDELLDRLLDRPLHAEPFAGAVIVGDALLLIADGVLLGAIDRADGSRGDRVAESLPAESEPRLHALPPELPPGTIRVITSVLHPPNVVHGDLDSSFINLPALARKLHDEGFDGVFRVHHGEAFGLTFFVGGRQVFSLYSEGWSTVPVEQSWSQWMARYPVTAQVEAKRVVPPHAWFRRAFRNAELTVEPMDEGDGDREDLGTTSLKLRQLFLSTRAKAVAPGRLAVRAARGTAEQPYRGAAFDRAPARRLLDWMLDPLLRHFAERDLVSGWRYLAEWLTLVRRVHLHHDLPRPKDARSDFFDLVTTDEDGKVLHLAHRETRPTADSFRAFAERVIEAKLARKKTGDVGGVLFVGRRIDEDVLAAYREVLAGTQSSGGGWFGVEESFTGYEGFVRVGPRRGFHLLLVEEKDDGSFVPLYPG